MSVIDDLLTKKKPQERSVTICLDPDAAAPYARARADLRRATKEAEGALENAALAAKVEAAQEALDAATAQLRDKVVVFTFRALDPTLLDDLMTRHRPTESQRTAARKRKEPEPQYNVDTFPPVIIAAACVKIEGPSGVSDGISHEDAERFWKSPDYNSAELAEVFHTAIGVQTQSFLLGDLPKGG